MFMCAHELLKRFHSHKAQLRGLKCLTLYLCVVYWFDSLIFHFNISKYIDIFSMKFKSNELLANTSILTQIIVLIYGK